MNKLKYHVSRITDLETSSVVENILLHLGEQHYQTVDVGRNSVTFEDHSGIVWNLQAIDRFSSGKFTIIDDTRYPIVMFDYHPFNWLDLVVIPAIVAAFLLGSIITGTYFVSFITIGFFAQMLVKVYRLKRKATSMLNDISRGKPVLSIASLQ